MLFVKHCDIIQNIDFKHFRRCFCEIFPQKLTFIPVLVLISAIIFPSFTALAADASYKFSAIDLKLKVPEELICFTQTTTGNNAYLKDIGAQDANEVQNSMKASNIYLEAFSKIFLTKLLLSE